MFTNLLLMIEMFFTIVIGLYFLFALKNQQASKTNITRGYKKEIDNLKKMRDIKLTVPFSEISRPTSFEEIIGQEKGIEALKAAICSPNPQHIIIYGPPGVGKTAAARLVLEEAKKKSYTPFKKEAKMFEIDATTVRFDDRGIADPLIGSVHDPIYQGAGQLGVAGVPQPKAGAVTKAHGGILFIDEIGELHPIEMNKLLKVMEDRKVFFDSAYYNSEDGNIPSYIKDIFDNGMPADFRLIGATTRNPEEILPAIRSRCVEVFFRGLRKDEIKKIVDNAAIKTNKIIEEEACDIISKYSSNGRDAINLFQMACSIALNSNREVIKPSDVQIVIENGNYTSKYDSKIEGEPEIGRVNGLAVYNISEGMVMEIEALAYHAKDRKGNFNITGIVEEEQINSNSRKMSRKSTAKCSVENVISVLENYFDIDFKEYNLHINFPGGIPVDGPSAGIAIACAIYSAVKKKYIDNKIAMTGEISLHGCVKAIGGVNAKIEAAVRAGAEKIIIPKENFSEAFNNIKNAVVIPVENINEVFQIVFDNEIIKADDISA